MAEKDNAMPDDERARGTSVADRAADGESDQLEAFPVGVIEGDAKVTHKTLIRPGEAVEYTVSLGRAEVPMRGGLVDPRKAGRCLVSYEAADGGLPVPQREDGKVKAWKIRQSLRPVYVEPWPLEDAEAIGLLFGTLMEASPQAAMKLVDGLQARAAEYLRTGDRSATPA
jgi:hypothetical protein